MTYELSKMTHNLASQYRDLAGRLHVL